MTPKSSSSADSPVVSQQIIDALQRGEPGNDIVMMVCELTGCTWDQAEAAIEKALPLVQERLRLRKRATILLVGSLTILGGGILFAYLLYLVIPMVQVNTVQADDPITFYFFFDFLVNQAPFFLAGMVFALTVIAGGAYGIGKELGT